MVMVDGEGRGGGWTRTRTRTRSGGGEYSGRRTCVRYTVIGALAGLGNSSVLRFTSLKWNVVAARGATSFHLNGYSPFKRLLIVSI